MLELGMTFSLEQLVLDNDMISMTKKAMEGVVVNEETMATDAIDKVGIGNNFLAHKTTRKNIDLPSSPMLIDRLMYGDWEAAGAKDIATVAHEKVVDIMKNHEVQPIDADLLKDMKAVVAKADEVFKAGA
jgi:trimethylamine--corrinoid protein Co-methyltransferase